MSWIADFVPPVSSRLPVSSQLVFTNILPVIALYYVTAVLVIIPGTSNIRLALLPLSLCSAFRAVTSIDIALAWNEPGFRCLDFGFGLNMIIISMRIIEWTFSSNPLQRVDRDATPSPDKEGSSVKPVTLKNALWDALDLIGNFRGIGWNWYQDRSMPKETRPTASTPAFLAYTALSALTHLVIFDVSVHFVRAFSPSTFGSPVGGTIFDHTLPPLERYARSTAITLLSGIMFYAVIQWIYDLNTINIILLFRQKPSRWPPLFDAPWRATSVADFWGKRWHQLFRSSFVSIGSKPGSYFAGKAGGVYGAFFVSAILHDWGMWPMAHGLQFSRVGGFFLAMGLGCISEKESGVRTKGWSGWVWTMLWIVGWGNLLVDAWARSGLLGSTIFPDMTAIVIEKLGSVST